MAFSVHRELRLQALRLALPSHSSVKPGKSMRDLLAELAHLDDDVDSDVLAAVADLDDEDIALQLPKAHTKSKPKRLKSGVINQERLATLVKKRWQLVPNERQFCSCCPRSA